MINILRLGSESFSLSPVMLFKCDNCYCVFEASRGDLKYDGDLNWFTAKCPCCDNNVHMRKEE